jgi:hypothetical protein
MVGRRPRRVSCDRDDRLGGTGASLASVPKHSLRRLATRFLTGSIGRLTAFMLDLLAAARAYAFARLFRRETRA